MSDDRGFTLIDLLLAITIGSILLVGIGSVLLTGVVAVRASVAGGGDVGVLVGYLERDVAGAVPDASLITLAADGSSITVAVPDPESGAVRRVTYAYTTGAGTDPDTTVGTITRTVRGPGGTASTLTLARSLDATFRGPVFRCAPGGASCAGATGVSASLATAARGEAARRTVTVAFRTQAP